MSLTTKKILVSIVSFALALCVSFAVVSFVTNGSNPAFATSVAPEKAEKVWEGDFLNYTSVYNKASDDVTLTKSANYINLLEDKTCNPYTNIIKVDIASKSVQKLSSGQTGTTISARWDGTDANKTALTTPQIHIYGEGILIGSTFVKGMTAANNTTNWYYTYNDGVTMSADAGYTVYFSVDNVKDGDTVTAFNVYFKMVRISDGKVMIEKLQNAPTSVTVDHSAESWVAMNGDSDTYYNQGYSSTQKVGFYAQGQETYKLQELVSDADMSYYYGQTSVTKSLDTASYSHQEGTGVRAIGFNQRMTFKLQNTNGSSGARLSFGTKYKDIYFKISFASNYIQVGSGVSSIGATDVVRRGAGAGDSIFYLREKASEQVPFTFDSTKEYKVSIAIRDVLDNEDNVVFRMPILEVAEIGNESNCATVCMVTDYIYEYKEDDQEIYCASVNETRTINIQANLLRLTTLGDSTTGSKTGFTMSSIDIWQSVTIIDGEDTASKKINMNKAVLPNAKNTDKHFSGYLCSANNQIYQPGVEIDLSAFIGTSDITFTAIYNNTVTIQDMAGEELATIPAMDSVVLPEYDGDKTFIAYKDANGILYKEGDTVQITTDAIFTLIDADVQILDEVAIRLSDDNFGGLRFAVKILTADLTALGEVGVSFTVKIDGVAVSINGTPAQDGDYTIAYYAKTDIEFAKFNTDISAEIVVDYQSGASVLLNDSANICTIALDIYNRNEVAKANGQALYNKQDAQRLNKYLSVLED